MELQKATEVKVIGYNMGEPADSLTQIFTGKVTQKHIEEMVVELDFPFPEIRVYQNVIFFVNK